jgi:hypothetical protein
MRSAMGQAYVARGDGGLPTGAAEPELATAPE